MNPGRPLLKLIQCITASFVLFSCVSPLPAQDIFKGYEQLFTTPRNYVAYQVSDSLIIDGRLNETSWEQAPWSDFFVDIEGVKRSSPTYKTRFKILWDEKHLYIAAALEEPHVWATLTKHDQIIYHDNDFEIFIDPDGDTHNYYEIEVNAFNTILDLFMPKPYRNGGRANLKWNVRQLKSSVHIDGTINQPDDIDKKWYVEIALPFSSLSLSDSGHVPKNKTIWNINFSRVQWDIEILNGLYKKKMDTVKKRPLPEHNWVWSPQGVINMHYPERWGYLQFSTNKAGRKIENFHVPAGDHYKKYLWLLYYKQKEYFHIHKQYATDLLLINFPSKISTSGGKGVLTMKASPHQYVAYIKFSAKESWQIDQEGKIIKMILQP